MPCIIEYYVWMPNKHERQRSNAFKMSKLHRLKEEVGNYKS